MDLDKCLFCSKKQLHLDKDPEGDIIGWFCYGCGGVGLGPQVADITKVCTDCSKEYQGHPTAPSTLCFPCYIINGRKKRANEASND